jgi:hypothetical protein
MKVVVQHTYAKTAEWQEADPKLYKGVWAFETTTDGKVLAKLGDGDHRWNDLKYFDIENIHGLPEGLSGLEQSIETETERATAAEQQLAQTVSDETTRAQEAEEQLQQNIDNKETFHDDTLAGTGTESDPLSVRTGAQGGINAGVTLVPDGAETVFPLPDNFVFAALSLVEINGLLQRSGADYALDAAAKTVTFAEPPEAGDTVTIYYIIRA